MPEAVLTCQLVPWELISVKFYLLTIGQRLGRKNIREILIGRLISVKSSVNSLASRSGWNRELATTQTHTKGRYLEH